MILGGIYILTGVFFSRSRTIVRWVVGTTWKKTETQVNRLPSDEENNNNKRQSTAKLLLRSRKVRAGGLHA